MIASPRPATAKVREFFDNLADWQTSVISLILHIIIILLLGGTVLYQAVKEPSDFTADGGFFGDGSEEEAPAGPTNLPPGPPAMPEIILPSPKETVSAISTTSTVAPTFVVPISTSAVSTMASQMMADAAQSAQASAKSLAGSMGGGGGGGGGAGAWGKSAGKGKWGKGFGSMEKDDMMLTGTFYDLKRPRQNSDTVSTSQGSGGGNNYKTVIGKFVESKFSPDVLKDFFRSEKPLYNSYIFIPTISAEDGPSAFGLKDVEPRRWLAHYAGGITPPKTGRYRFWGMGDDVLIVAVEKKVVLDASLTNYPGRWKASEPFAPIGTGLNLPRMIRPGDWINLSDQETYRIDIVIGEEPGGLFTSLLLVEQEGKTYEKNSYGLPIVSLFSTLPMNMEEMPKLKDAPKLHKEAVIMTPKKNVMGAGTSNETL